MRPIARTDHVTVQVLPEETLVYERETHRLHCLNRTAALVWKHCDGQHDLPALAGLVADALGLPAGEAEAATRLALEQLSRRGLVQQQVAKPAAPDERLTRRAALRRVAVTAAGALPVVMTLRSPAPAWGARTIEYSGCALTGVCPPGQTCSRTTTPSGNHLSSMIINGTCIAAPEVPSFPPISICTGFCFYDASGKNPSFSPGACPGGGSCKGKCPPNGPANGTVPVIGTC